MAIEYMITSATNSPSSEVSISLMCIHAYVNYENQLIRGYVTLFLFKSSSFMASKNSQIIII
jgi:hypothetical protein